MQLLQALRAATGNGAAQFLSGSQEDEVRAALAVHEDRLVIQPTGSGKTLLYQLPALLHRDRVIVVVCPLTALQDDLLRRCNDAGIDTVMLEDRDAMPARIVLTMVEATESREYGAYVRALVAHGRLHCIIVEEMYLALLSCNYRPAMRNLYLNLRPNSNAYRRRAPDIALTATCPPRLTKKMLDYCGMEEETTHLSLIHI